MNTSDAGYPLGSDPAELARLIRQGEILAAITRTILETGGIRPGMRVLDLVREPVKCRSSLPVSSARAGR